MRRTEIISTWLRLPHDLKTAPIMVSKTDYLNLITELHAIERFVEPTTFEMIRFPVLYNGRMEWIRVTY